MNSSAPYEPLQAEEVPKVGEALSFDIYVKLPKAGRFIRYACAGETWEAHQQENIKKHNDPTLYRNSEAIVADATLPPIGTPDDIQALNDTVADDLKEVFRFLHSDNAEDVPKTIKALEELSQKIINVVAPDVEDLKASILQQSKYIMVMTDSAALTSIATLVALSHGFDSRKVFRDLSFAILLMDAPLADLAEELVLTNYRDRSSLRPEVWEEIRRHPAKAHEVVSTRLKLVTDSVLNIILNHHELYNSKGYPRKIRNETLPPIVRSVALAVDIFEIMKREFLRGSEIDIPTALEELRQPDVEPHLRRHNQSLVSKSREYIEGVIQNVEDAKKPASE